MPGRYRLSVSGSDAFGWRPKFAALPTTERRLTDLDALDVPFTVEPDHDVLGVQIEMSFAPPTVAGRIDGPDGRPAPGVSVVVFATDSTLLDSGIAANGAGADRFSWRFSHHDPARGRLSRGGGPLNPRAVPEPWLESLRPRAVPFRLDDGEAQELALRLPGGLSAQRGPATGATSLPPDLSKLWAGRRLAPANGRVSERRLSIQNP